jgi:hypothetical protein
MLNYFAPIETFRPQFLVAMCTGNVDYAFNLLEGEDQAVMASSFKLIGADYLLDIRLKQPASVFIGSFAREGLPAEEFHAGLGSALESSMEACLSCHNCSSARLSCKLRRVALET